MSLPLLMLICVSVVQLCVGDLPMEEVIQIKNVPLLGDWFEKDPKSVDVEEAAQYGVKMFNEQSKAKKMFKLISVNKAKTQVSNVINYKIEAILGKTKCVKSENHDLESCSLVKKKLRCNFEVAFDPRSSQHSLLSHKCSKIMRIA